MVRKPVAAAIAASVSACCLAGGPALAAPETVIPASVKSVEFVGMAAPSTPEQRAQTYTEARLKVTYRNGRTTEIPLTYHRLFWNTDTIGGVTAGMIYDVKGQPLLDVNGNPHIAETPDANSLLRVPGATRADPESNPLFLVTHYEYDWLDTAGNDQYGKQPMTMSLATIRQDKDTGAMRALALENIDMADVKGLWIPCAGTLSPWNTHLGSEEYEPDGRCALDPSDPAYSCASGAIMLDSMARYLAPLAAEGVTPNVYDYGLTPEVTIDRHGETRVEKHRTLGRISRELVEVMPDRRTVYQGDDGTYNVLTMFVADRRDDLSAGTLYAAKWNQTSDPSLPGGEAQLTWYRLGHASDAQIEKMVARGITFSDIFETSAQAAPGFTTIKAGHSKGLVEHLKLKPGMEKAAAFLETRRYAAYVGATTEFEKFEGVALNAADRKVYVAMTRLRDGMEDRPSDPANHIRVPRLIAGAVYEIDLAGNQLDSDGRPIASRFVGTAMRARVLGEDIPKDAVGNTAAVDKIANPDNLKFSEKMRTLFIGEDSSTAHINNFLWAYHVDTGVLSRILSLPAGAESTGLQAVDDLNGFAYIMSNYQHAGDYSSNIDPTLKAQLEPLIEKERAAIGYIGSPSGGLPGLK
jgi:hypothetical protein